jgi:ferritin-like metal-binding protein YciE
MKKDTNKKAGNTAQQQKPGASMQGGKQQGNGRQNQPGQQQGEQEKEIPEVYLHKFFADQLKDMFYAEKKLITALNEMKEACTTEELEDAFDDHIKQTERHVKRLEKVFRSIGKEPEEKTCEAMDGLIKEAKTIIEETEEGSMTRDAALIIAAQKVEHYEIATYGGLVQLAVTMELHQAAEFLDKTLQEEEETDRLLTEIAESYINVEAELEGEQEEEKEGEEEEEEPVHASASAF